MIFFTVFIFVTIFIYYFNNNNINNSVNFYSRLYYFLLCKGRKAVLFYN